MESGGSHLAELSFFKGMERQHLDAIAACATTVQFKRDEYLFCEGQEAHGFHVIQHGKVALEIRVPGGGPVTIQTVGVGEVLGWSWLVSPYKKAFDARAVAATRAIAFDGAGVRKQCEQDPALGYELLKRFCQVIGQRLRATSLQLQDVYGSPAEQECHDQ